MSDSRPHYTTPIRRITRTDCETLIQLTLAEDTPAGDPTSESIFSFEQHGTGRIVARESGVLCGLAVIEHLCEINRERTGHAVQYVSSLQDGQPFNAGAQLLQLHGPLPTILTLERPVLNFLQYLSGISSVVARAVQAAGPDIAILDTRKTIPGYRKLAKYAVYCGGGTNHRICLSDMAMIKDNHVAAAGGITNAVQAIRKRHPDLPLEVEVDALEQLSEALPLQPDVILLDNMRRPDIERAVRMVQSHAADNGGRAPFIEISGGWRPDQLSELQGLGRLGVSMGYLTHTTRFLDLSMEFDDQ